jgi:hypothetical protein
MAIDRNSYTSFSRLDYRRDSGVLPIRGPPLWGCVVTAGTIGVNNVNNANFSGVGFYRTWSGTDGKTETYAGSVRDKWNNYIGLTRSGMRIQPTYTIKTPSGPQTLNAVVAFTTQSLPITANEQNGLLSKLSAKVKGHEFNLAVDLAQLNQTTGMLSSSLGTIGRSFLALKHGDFATAARTLGVKPRASRLKSSDLSGRWLELQYGWLPTLSSCYEASKAFEQVSRGPRSTLFRVSKRKVVKADGSSAPTLYSQYYTVSTTRYLQYEMYEEMSAARSLGLMNPLSVAWEVVPYSFVVDWFIPVGTYLDNLMAIPKLLGRFLTTDVNRCQGFEGFVIKSKVGDFHQGYVYQGLISPPGMDSRRACEVRRTYSTSLSVPLPGFDLSGAISVRRFWNALALCHQRFVK